MALCSSAVKANQRRAFEFVGSLLKFYGDYRTQKEREAYVVTVLYLGATGAVFANEELHRHLVLVGLAAATLLVALLVGWQLGNLRFAARMVAACVNVSSQWLQHPPGPDAIRAIPLCGHGAEVPADVAKEFGKQSVCAVRVGRVVIPALILVWGGALTVVLWRCQR
jgi:hypothetical protein